MGSFIQKVFQRRGDKKGQGFWLKRSIPLLFLVLTWLGLLKDFPLTMPSLWFPFSGITAVSYSIPHFSSKRRDYQLFFLLSLILIFEGTIHAANLLWLKSAYFPLIIFAAVFYKWKTVILLPIFIFLFSIKSFIAREFSIEEIAFSGSLLLTSAIASAIFGRLRKEKDKAVIALKTLTDTAKGIAPETAMESLDSDAAVSHYFASMLKTDEEIRDLLLTIRHAVFADSANFFAPLHNSFALRSSTQKKGDIIVTGKGVIASCLTEKKPFYSGEINEKKFDAGYIKNEKVLSIYAAPVMDGSALMGVLTVDSSRYQAFSEPDRSTVQMFTDHLARILERERIYPRIKRHYNGLKILNEESAKLVSSLDINVIAEKLCEGAEKIALSQVFFFILNNGNFELIHQNGNIPEKKTLFDPTGTLINMAVESTQPLYIPDMTNYKIPVMPFRTEDVRSVIVIPLRYENKLFGLFVMLSEKKDFLDSFQIELLKVMCNQASTSMANANLHSEIEKLATTDGLTGLFNHRVFQERLSEEFKKLSRYSEPTSLLLTDIDFFKKVNDKYGHPVGDLVLKEVAKLIKETIRDIDIAARYGGEEFAIILPRTDSSGAKNIAERLRKTVMETSFPADASHFEVTLSIGIATAPSDTIKKEALIEKADQALYHAKHNGRNQCVLWNELVK